MKIYLPYATNVIDNLKQQPSKCSARMEGYKLSVKRKINNLIWDIDLFYGILPLFRIIYTISFDTNWSIIDTV